MVHESVLTKKTVYICSPLRDTNEQVMAENQLKAQEYMRYYREKYDCHPIAPQAYLPYLLNDLDPKQRELALSFCIKMLELCDTLVICGDHISDGMKLEITYALKHGINVLCRPESAMPFQEFLRAIKPQREEAAS